MDLPFAPIEHQRSCAILVASTAKTFLPILKPLSGHAAPWGFYYDFLCDSPVDKLVLTLLTEEMRRIIRRDLAFKELTMVPQNAKDFLQKSQPLQAALLEGVDATTVDLIQIDSFYDISLGPCLATTTGLSDFALLKIETKEALYEPFGPCQVVRIHGVVCVDKKALKSYVKTFDAAEKHDPAKIAQQRELLVLDEGYPIWYPAGLAYTDNIVQHWKCLAKKYGIMELRTPHHRTKESHLKVLKRTGEWMQAQTECLPQDLEGLFVTAVCFRDTIFSLCKTEELEQECISSLQFIKELHTIIGIDAACTLVRSHAKRMQVIQDRMARTLDDCGISFSQETSRERNAKPRLEFRIHDLRKREWLFAFVEVEWQGAPTEDKLLWTQSSIVSVERLLGIQLELIEQTCFGSQIQ